MKLGENLFQTKLLSRLSQKVCHLLSSPVLLRNRLALTGLAIRKPLVQVPPLVQVALNKFLRGSREFKSLAMLGNSQLVCLRPDGILNPAGL